jgi:DNA repair protein RecN (Recombination protein N)
MLERLEVHGLGIIDAVTLEFDEGFSVLTGETGAGKSLLVESLKLLSGHRSQADMVRTGDDRLRIEGWFTSHRNSRLDELIDELGVAQGDVLVMRREVLSTGRSRCWVNDVSVTATALQRIARHLVSIHGQHEQHGLGDSRVQRDVVDQFGGLGELCEEVGATFGNWAEAAAEVDRLCEAQARRRDRLDTIAFQIGEIDAADPRGGEDQDLLARRQLLRHGARVREISGDVMTRLADDESAVVDVMAQAERHLREMADLGLPLEQAAADLSEARVQIEEIVREVRDAVAGVDEDPAELENVEARLHRLDQLMLKYGSPIEEVLRHRDRLAAERDELVQVEDRLGKAESSCRAALEKYDRAAGLLDDARVQAGAELAMRVEGVLAALNMGGTRLEFQWNPRHEERSSLLRDGVAVAFDEDGVNECRLMIAANPGEELRPMARIASGGELSRVHLALRTVLLGRSGDHPLTLLFDEVDSGLGGATAAALADLLSHLAAENQVLVVTHLPQVAAGAGNHYRVEKVLENGRAVTRATGLDAAGRELEVARMLAGGEVTDSARSHARSLMGVD